MQILLQLLSTGEGVMKVLGLILALGNYMNHGNYARGSAGGFELELLSKLADVQSNDKKASLLSVVAKLYIDQFDCVSVLLDHKMSHDALLDHMMSHDA